MHDAGLDADRFGIGAHDAAHRFGEIENQTGAQRFAGQAGACAARMDGNSLFGGVADDGGDVGGIARPHHAQRLDLIDAGVAGVQLNEQIVAPHVAGDESAQVVLNSLAFGIHGKSSQASGARDKTQHRSRILLLTPVS